LLQKIRFITKNIASDFSAKIKDNFDKSAFPYAFQINDLVWFEDFAPLGKNPKLTPKWQGPAKVTEVNDTNARLLQPNRRTKIYNIMRLKKFFAPTATSTGNTDTQHIDLEFRNEPKITGPVTHAMKYLMQQKDAIELAISVLCDLTKQLVLCASGNKNVQAILCCLTLFLPDTTFTREKIASSTNNQCAQCANCN
jgi:hypothetical protein